MRGVLKINVYRWEHFMRSICTRLSVTKKKVVFTESVLADKLGVLKKD